MIDKITYIGICEVKQYMITDYKSKIYYIGSKWTNNQGCKAKIIGRSTLTAGSYYIQFLDKYNVIKEVRGYNLKIGRFINPYAITVYGIGYLGNGPYTVSINRKSTTAHHIWTCMLNRCYSDNCYINKPTYNDVTVDERWHNFQVFAEWYYKNEIYGYQLDKDLLSGDTKIYSPETCVFLPQSINSFLANINSSNTSGFTGVTWHKSSKIWRASINIYKEDKSTYIGSFKTAEEASKAYQKARAIEAEKVKEEMRQLGYWNEYIINHIM